MRNGPTWDEHGMVIPDRGQFWRHVQPGITDTEKKRCRGKFNYAVKIGRIKRPETCPSCGKKTMVHGHHPDYTKPFEFEWGCADCHLEKHAEMNEVARHRARQTEPA